MRATRPGSRPRNLRQRWRGQQRPWSLSTTIQAGFRGATQFGRDNTIKALYLFGSLGVVQLGDKCRLRRTGGGEQAHWHLHPHVFSMAMVEVGCAVVMPGRGRGYNVCVCVVVVGAVTGATVSMQTEVTAARAPRHTYRGSRLCAEETASEGSSGRAGSERGNRSRYTSHTPLAS